MNKPALFSPVRIFFTIAISVLFVCSCGEPSNKGKNSAKSDGNETNPKSELKKIQKTIPNDQSNRPPQKEAQSSSAQNPANTQSGAQSNESLFQGAVLILLLISISTTIFFCLQLFRWKKRSVDGKHFITVPDTVQDYVETSGRNMKVMAETIVAFNNQLETVALQSSRLSEVNKQSVINSINEFEQHLETVNQLSEDRKHEVERFRNGYDIVSKEACLKSIMQTVDHLDGYVEELRNSSSVDPVAFNYIESTRDQLAILLENENIERFDPELSLNASDEKARGKINVIGTIEANSPEQVGLIAEVRTPCYFVKITETDIKVIRPASVVVFKEFGSK